MIPHCSVYIATSLDGFIAGEDGELSFLAVADSETHDYGYRSFIDRVDAIVMGRGTYEAGLAFPTWPYEGKRVIVLTSGASPQAQHGEEFVAGDIPALLERLGTEGVHRVYVDGGATIRSFLAAGFIDDLTISIVPMLLGRGIPLFGLGIPRLALELTGSESYETGLVQLRYRVNRAATA